MLWTDAARLFIGSSVLVFTAWADLRWRRAPDAAWWTVAGAGAVLLVVDWVVDPARVRDGLVAMGVAAVIGVLALLSYRFGVLMGGADAKALAAFSVLLPLPLDSGVDVLFPSPFPVVLSALGDALVAAPFIPLAFLLYNLSRGDRRLPLALVGFRRAVAGLDDAHVWPLEWVGADGSRRHASAPGRVDLDRARERHFREAGIDRVWVTPKIPFLVPLAVGFVAAFLVGDVLAALVKAVVG